MNNAIAVVLLAVCCTTVFAVDGQSPAVLADARHAMSAVALLRQVIVHHVLAGDNQTSAESLRSKLTAAGMSCDLCTKAVGAVEGYILQHGCGLLFDGVALSACEAAGLGPEDPLSEVCVGVLISGCGKIAGMLANHIVDKPTICRDALSLC